jgi:uncharacterized protein (UPF0332 family)
MSFDWTQYFQLACELANQAEPGSASGEAKLRCAVSRAYYAAFCTARNHLRDNEKKPISTGPEAHDFVRAQFGGGTEPRKKVGVNLARLHLDRKKADYDDVFPKLRETTELDLKIAERIIASVHALGKL